MAHHTPKKRSHEQLREYLTPNTSKKLKSPNDISQLFYPGCIRQGENYQAEIPDILQDNNSEDESSPNALNLCIWSPSYARIAKISDDQLLEFISTAGEEHSLNEEQALGLIAWKKYDMEAAKKEIHRWCPVETLISDAFT